jgi:RHS repeat-associated protein
MKMRIVLLLLASIAAPLQAQDVWQYSYDGAGNITRAGTDEYRYDHAGRLTSSNQQQFAYDLHGNLTRITTGTQTAGFALDGSTNQLDGTCPDGTDLCYRAIYDPAGNVVGRAAAGEFQWDPLGVLKERHSDRDERFLYDANDERIATIQPTFTRYTLRAADHKVVRELTDAGGIWSLTRDYVHRGGTLVASYSGTSATPNRHYHVDHLGSTRLVTDANGFRVSATTYLPFGREAEGSEASAERMKFTGHERDATGNSPGLDLDYMHVRYYDPTAGRFLSVDPGADWDPAKPQSWNLYAYVRNDPVNRTDPTGANSYMVSRPLYVTIKFPLAGALGARVLLGDHMFLASHARYPGDPKAHLHSFGETTQLKAGRVDTTTTGSRSEDTAMVDSGYWRSLAQPSTSDAQVAQIPASDGRVEGVANAVVEDRPYVADNVGRGDAFNSNTIVQAVANTAAGQPVPPPGPYKKIGAEHADQVRFDAEEMKRVPPR